MEIVNSKRYPIRFVNTEMQQIYEDCRRRGADPNSDLYLADGSRQTGSIDGVCYWRGRDGTNPTMHDDSLAFPCWRAGKDDRLAARAQIRDSIKAKSTVPMQQRLGYAVEKQAIRDRLVAAGMVNGIELHHAIEQEYVAAHANDPSYCEISQSRPTTYSRSDSFRRDELERIVARFEGANDPESAAVSAKAKAMLARLAPGS